MDSRLPIWKGVRAAVFAPRRYGEPDRAKSDWEARRRRRARRSMGLPERGQSKEGEKRQSGKIEQEQRAEKKDEKEGEADHWRRVSLISKSCR